MNPRLRLPKRSEQPRRPALRPGRTTSTGGHRRGTGSTSVQAERAASEEGQSAASTQTAPSIGARSSATSRTW